jgi:acylphosphatase
VTGSAAPGAGNLHAIVRGSVQGVGFRWYVSRAAARLQLTGWVANLPDGSVEVVAEGPTGALEALVEVIRRGPPGAEVTGVDVSRSEARGGLADFGIRSGWHSGD